MPDESKVEQELLPRFAQLKRVISPGFYARYEEGDLDAIDDFLSRLASTAS